MRNVPQNAATQKDVLRVKGDGIQNRSILGLASHIACKLVDVLMGNLTHNLVKRCVPHGVS